LATPESPSCAHAVILMLHFQVYLQPVVPLRYPKSGGDWGEWHHRKELFYIIHLVFNLFAVVVQSLWNLRYCRESSTAATTDGADGRKIGDVLLTNMTVLQVGSVLIVQVMFTSRAEIAY